MSAERLYNEIYEQLTGCVSAEVDKSTRQRLALLIIGMIEAKSAAPAQIAQAIHRLGLSEAEAESIERRIRRSENDQEISDALCFHPFARQRLLWAKQDKMLLILDPTTQDDRVCLVTAAVWYRGRALPVAWLAWAANTPLEGDSFWVRIAQLLQTVATILPCGVHIIWLADRAFGTPVFTNLVIAHGWDYVVRVQAQTRCRDALGREQQIHQLLQPHRCRGKMRGEAFKKRGWQTNSVVAFWGKRHTAPLCLVSSLPACWSLIRLYRRRYPIEATFRDFKSSGWQWEKGQVADLAHVQRLLVAMAFASWFAIAVGAYQADLWLHRPPSGKRRTRPWWSKRSLFTIGLHFLRRALLGHDTLFLGRPLTDWPELNWQEQAYFHQARAFVFAS